MSESNYGSVYYDLSCGIPSTSGVNIESNIATGYYHLSANDFILWGQDATYPQLSTNIGTNYYFLECGVASLSDINLESNSGTTYYYSSAFNCVSFCD